MVDEAHATGALGPGGRGSVAAAGLSGEVDVVVGTLGKALGSYGAYVCAGRRPSTTSSTRRAPSSSRPPFLPRSSPRPMRRSSCSPPGRTGSSDSRTTPPTLRAALAEEGLAVGGSESQIVPVPIGDAGRAMELCERALGTRRLRPGHPPADRPGGILAPALHRDGDPPPRRAARAPRSWSAPRRGRWVSPPRRRPRWRSPPESSARASSSPAPGLRSARPWSRRRSPTPSPRPASGSPSSSPPSPGSTSQVRPTTSCCGAPRARPRPTRRSPPTATAPRPRLTSPPRLAGEEIDPDRLLEAARAAAEGADALVCEGVGGLLVPLASGYMVRDLAVDLALPLVIAAAPGLGTINHTLLTLEAARAAGLDGRRCRPHTMASGPQRGRGIEPRDDRQAGRGQGRDAAAPRSRRP